MKRLTTRKDAYLAKYYVNRDILDYIAFVPNLNVLLEHLLILVRSFLIDNGDNMGPL